MAQHLQETFATAKYANHQAIARASLVMAVAYHIAGDFELSRPWYERARLNAAAEGDDATVSATLHNMASIRASNIRLVDTFGGDTEKETKRVTLEASSSHVYDFAIGHKGLDFLAHMLRGLIATIDRKFDDALNIFGLIDVSKVPERLRPLVLVDQAWCEANRGHTALSLDLARQTESRLSSLKDDDDLAYVHSRLRQIALACSQPEMAVTHAKTALEALDRHRQFQADLLARLNSINTDGQWKSPA